MSIPRSSVNSPSPLGRFRRPFIVCTAGTLLSELALLLVFGIWLYPEGSLLSKTLWTIVFCGLGMGLALGVAVGQFVVPCWDGGKAIAASTALSVGILGVGCNLLCFTIDRHLNHFGVVNQPVVWLSSAVVLASVGGVAGGALLFTERGRRLLDRCGL